MHSAIVYSFKRGDNRFLGPEQTYEEPCTSRWFAALRSWTCLTKISLLGVQCLSMGRPGPRGSNTGMGDGRSTCDQPTSLWRRVAVTGTAKSCGEPAAWGLPWLPRGHGLCLVPRAQGRFVWGSGSEFVIQKAGQCTSGYIKRCTEKDTGRI